MGCVNDSLLDESLINEIYSFLNDTEIFSIREKFKIKHSRVCAVIDRLRISVPWINNHLEVPRGAKAPYRLPVFMMHASIVKSGVESLLKDFGLYNELHDVQKPVSKLYFREPLRESPLNINDSSCITDDDFFQYFRSLVFAHPQGVTSDKKIMRSGETQFCPFIVEQSLQYYASEPDDYVGVMIYSTEQDRDFKTIRVRFVALLNYIKSRFEALKLLTNHLGRALKEEMVSWKRVAVNEDESPVNQLKFILAHLESRHANWPSYYTKEILSLLEAPCSCEDNEGVVMAFRETIIKRLPELVSAFKSLDYERYCTACDELIDHSIPDVLGVSYSVGKIFEYMDDSDRYEWVRHDLRIARESFVDKWVRIDFDSMTKEEIALLVTIACRKERMSTKGLPHEV